MGEEKPKPDNAGKKDRHRQIGAIEKMVQSVTYNTYFKKYLLLGNTSLYDPNRGQWVYGFYYSTSSDLLNWSLRTLLLEIPLWNYQCGGEDEAAYPVALNPARPSWNRFCSSSVSWDITHAKDSRCSGSALKISRSLTGK